MSTLVVLFLIQMFLSFLSSDNYGKEIVLALKIWNSQRILSNAFLMSVLNLNLEVVYKVNFYM